MRIFITGGTGFIGSAVVKELIDAGHEVIGLARSESSTQALQAVGVSAVQGSLEDIDSLKRGAERADAVIHTAFIHNFADFAAAAEVDRQAITALGETLAGSNRPFVVTSGVPSGQSGQLVTEDIDPPPVGFPRVSEAAALPFVKRGVRVSLVRPSRFVHGASNHGFIARLIEIARESGQSAYVENGENRIHAVHYLDVATLYRLIVEKGIAGAKYQAVTDSGIEFRKIAEVIANKLNIPTVSIPAKEAQSHFGFLGAIVSADNPASSQITQNALGWQPTQPSFLEDLTNDFYYTDA
ncbi:putative NAD-dependent epimerase/dehydratase [Actinomycetota bacterium]|nr:putative NAD-dependent epimerase/dehydratase [Actinomycetota bacterium]